MAIMIVLLFVFLGQGGGAGCRGSLKRRMTPRHCSHAACKFVKFSIQ